MSIVDRGGRVVVFKVLSLRWEKINTPPLFLLYTSTNLTHALRGDEQKTLNRSASEAIGTSERGEVPLVPAGSLGDQLCLGGGLARI